MSSTCSTSSNTGKPPEAVVERPRRAPVRPPGTNKSALRCAARGSLPPEPVVELGVDDDLDPPHARHGYTLILQECVTQSSRVLGVARVRGEPGVRRRTAEECCAPSGFGGLWRQLGRPRRRWLRRLRLVPRILRVRRLGLDARRPAGLARLERRIGEHLGGPVGESPSAAPYPASSAARCSSSVRLHRSSFVVEGTDTRRAAARSTASRLTTFGSTRPRG